MHARYIAATTMIKMICIHFISNLVLLDLFYCDSATITFRGYNVQVAVTLLFLTLLLDLRALYKSATAIKEYEYRTIYITQYAYMYVDESIPLQCDVEMLLPTPLSIYSISIP